jgi:hypothetical protein
MIPYLDRPVSRARYKHSFIESVPFDCIYRHVMAVERSQPVLVLFRVLVYFAVLGADYEQVVLLVVEVEARTRC